MSRFAAYALALVATLLAAVPAVAATVEPYELTLTGKFTSTSGTLFNASRGDDYTVTFSTALDTVPTVTTSPDNYVPGYGVGHNTYYAYVGTITLSTDEYTGSFAGRLVWTDGWLGTTTLSLTPATAYLPVDTDSATWGTRTSVQFFTTFYSTQRGFTDFSLPNAELLNGGGIWSSANTTLRTYVSGGFGASGSNYSITGPIAGAAVTGLPSPVPLPAGGLLLASALVGASVLRRKKAA